MVCGKARVPELNDSATRSNHRESWRSMEHGTDNEAKGTFVLLHLLQGPQTVQRLR